MGNDAAAKCLPGGGGTSLSAPATSTSGTVDMFHPAGGRVGPTTRPSRVSSTSSARSFSVYSPVLGLDVRSLT